MYNIYFSVIYCLFYLLYIYNINYIYIYNSYNLKKHRGNLYDCLIRATLFLLEKARASFFITAIRDMIRKNSMFCFVNEC